MCGDGKEAYHANQNDMDWKILSDVFDDLDHENKIVCSVVEFRSWLWEKYRINKKDFQTMMERVCAENSPYRNKIHLSGGPTGHYTKTNFVVVGGRHYLVIQIDTPKHLQYTEGHRS